jgi:ribosome-binding factor A
MSKVRVGRVGEQVKKELSAIIQKEVKDPRLGFVTVTAVDMSGDLSQARVFLSIMGTPAQQTATFHQMEKSSGFLRTELGKRMRLRHVPELLFKMDSSVEYGNKIDQLLNDMARGGDEA